MSQCTQYSTHFACDCILKRLGRLEKQLTIARNCLQHLHDMDYRGNPSMEWQVATKALEEIATFELDEIHKRRETTRGKE